MPGEYLVAAISNGPRPAARTLTTAEVDAALRGENLAAPVTPPAPVRYAPVFFPGTTRSTDATPILLVNRGRAAERGLQTRDSDHVARGRHRRDQRRTAAGSGAIFVQSVGSPLGTACHNHRWRRRAFQLHQRAGPVRADGDRNRTAAGAVCQRDGGHRRRRHFRSATADASDDDGERSASVRRARHCAFARRPPDSVPPVRQPVCAQRIWRARDVSDVGPPALSRSPVLCRAAIKSAARSPSARRRTR